MPIDQMLEEALMAESRFQREAWVKLMPGCPMPRKKEKA